MDGRIMPNIFNNFFNSVMFNSLQECGKFMVDANFKSNFMVDVNFKPNFKVDRNLVPSIMFMLDFNCH